jgi:hypothetical protein
MLLVILSNKDHYRETNAILDNGSECTLLLSTVTKHLGLDGAAEDLLLWTILQESNT